MIEQFGILKNDQTCFLNFQEFLNYIFKTLRIHIFQIITGHFQIIVMIYKYFIKILLYSVNKL